MIMHRRVVEYGRPSVQEITQRNYERQMAYNSQRANGYEGSLEREVLQEENGVDELLAKGWKVTMMCPFSQCVSFNLGSSDPSIYNRKTADYGEYGIVYILEKDFPEKDDDTTEDE
ncbi:MAG: hypothetical protein HFJ24_05585 [Clostridia bacterium]|nr:hypothetical protein [Clostridia bacterium]MCI9275428.1 hypothetical protein [Clostridia bacterium]